MTIEHDLEAATALWGAYLAAQPQAATGSEDAALPDVTHFGDSPELADELLALVTHGPKRATAGLVAEFAAEGELLPRIGGHWIACDGSGRPRVVLRSTELRVGPLVSVDAEFAWDEGEDDRTLTAWLEGHRRYFRRSCERLGLEFTDQLEVVFERFAVVWPPELAD